MTDTDITDRFVIEVSRVGTVDHIVDLEAEPVDRTPYSPRRDLPGEKLCDRSTRSPASEYIELPDYADWKGLDKPAFDGDAPDEVCSYCWTDVLTEIEREEQFVSDDRDKRVGTVGYRLRWKQKGRARKEWYDIVVRPETTMAELDTLICRFTTLDDFHLRMYGLEDEYMDSTLNVIPDQQFTEIDDPSYMKASEMTIADVADRATLWDGDRLSMVYDFGTPSHYYCIVKDVYDPDEIERLLDEREPIAATATAAIIDQKRP
ncbi:hypothetical protein C448_01374 [Halococcus morrhuae DSM 1307]|uniref:Uncharacterized protein n=2 Tax=Halococcus TaxID=2249 RepID=M0MXU3_HALMO|nr:MULTISPECIES: hypothetical protein [Halococcus]EMA50527.1 hypothetical protein C448_01374 [Halococcus morrhuae DSM 1307]UOO97514.1 hypothetical protein MUK72_18805 [Halococcus dombrowskii]